MSYSEELAQKEYGMALTDLPEEVRRKISKATRRKFDFVCIKCKRHFTKKIPLEDDIAEVFAEIETNEPLQSTCGRCETSKMGEAKQ